MKKIVIFMTFIVIATSCKKTILEDAPGIENGVSFMQYKDVPTVSAFNTSTISTLAYFKGDWAQENAYNIVSTIPLQSSNTLRTVYLATVPGVVGPSQAEQYFENHGYVMAPLERVGGLINKYGVNLMGITFMCTNIPKDVDLGNGNGAEPIVMQVQGFIPSAYAYFTPKSNSSYAAAYAVMKK